MDPYKVLGVTPQTSDDDVKRAYRELARKYHPDNYVNNPLADLAEARMKEINEAYDTIMSERSGKTGAGAGSTGQSYNGQTYGQSYGGQRTYSLVERRALCTGAPGHQSGATSTWPRACSPVRPAATPSGSS